MNGTDCTGMHKTPVQVNTVLCTGKRGLNGTTALLRQGRMYLVMAGMHTIFHAFLQGTNLNPSLVILAFAQLTHVTSFCIFCCMNFLLVLVQNMSHGNNVTKQRILSCVNLTWSKCELSCERSEGKTGNPCRTSEKFSCLCTLKPIFFFFSSYLKLDPSCHVTRLISDLTMSRCWSIYPPIWGICF